MMDMLRARLKALPGLTMQQTVDTLSKALEMVRRGLPAGGQLQLLENIEHHSRHQPRDATGRFVERLSDGRRLWAAERAAYQQRGYLLSFDDAMQALQRGDARPTQATWQAKRLLRHNYESMFELGRQAAGNPIAPSDDELKLLEGIIREQYGFVDGFVGAVEDDRGKLNYDDRAHMHGMHARTAYWLGWLVGNTDPGRQIRWIMHPEKEHCGDCLAMATTGDLGGGLWTPLALLKTGLTPHSGRLECKGYYCGCELHESFLRGERKEDGPRAGYAGWLEPTRTLRWDRGGAGREHREGNEAAAAAGGAGGGAEAALAP